MERVKQLLICGLACLFSIEAQAGIGCWGGLCDEGGWAQVISLSAGPVWASSGKTENFYSTTPSTTELTLGNQFVVDKKTLTFVTGEAFFALENYISNWLIGRFGVAAAWSGNAMFRGTVNFAGTPNATRYSYKLSHARVALKGLLAATQPNWFVQPYVSASVGASFNNSSSFQTSNTIVFTDTSGVVGKYTYGNYTATSFAYTVGAGLQKYIARCWQVGVGYEFADWGKSSLKSVLPAPFNYSSPNMSHFYTNQVLFTLSYITG